MNMHRAITEDTARALGLASDAAIEAEETLMARLFRTEAAYRDALAAVGRNSMFYADKGERLEAFNDFAHDESPDPDSWAEKLAGVSA